MHLLDIQFKFLLATPGGGGGNISHFSHMSIEDSSRSPELLYPLYFDPPRREAIEKTTLMSMYTASEPYIS